MKHVERIASKVGVPGFLAALVMTIGMGVCPKEGWSQVTISPLCADAANNPERDTDGDGFTDLQECNGIRTIPSDPAIPPRIFNVCGAGGAVTARELCVDPGSKDLFVIYKPDTLIGAIQNPFAPVSFYGISFRGLSSLGVAVHQLTEAETSLDRTVSTSSKQKAIKVSASPDTNGTVLGQCQWGTPMGLDGCVVFTQRTRNFITNSCAGQRIFTPAGVESSVDEVFKAYMTYLVLHESGHSLGGLTAKYDSRFGGYHYKSGSGLVMDQAVTYTAKRRQVYVLHLTHLERLGCAGDQAQIMQGYMLRKRAIRKSERKRP